MNQGSFISIPIYERPNFSNDIQLANLIINSSPDLIYSFDNAGCFTNVNYSFCRALQINADDIIGKTYYELGFTEAICKQWDELRETVFISRGKLTSYSSVTMQDEKTYHFKLRLYPILSADGSVTGITVITSDISLAEEVKNELIENRNEFLNIIENAPDIMAIHAQGKFLFINKLGIRLAKAKGKEDFIGKSIWPIVHPDHKAIAEERVKNIMQNKTIQPAIETKYLCMDGSVLEVEVRSMPIKFERKDAILLIARDITEKKKSQEALREERLMLRTVIDNIPDSIYVKDMDGRKLIANLQDQLYMGITDEKEAIGKTDKEIYTKEQVGDFFNEDQQVLQQGKSILNKLNYFIDNHQKEHWILTSKVPLRNEQHEITGLVGIGTDITERQKMIEQLFETQERLNKIILSSSDWVCEVNARGVYTYCSDTVENILGYRPGEITGKNAFDFLNNDKNISTLNSLQAIIKEQANIINLENWNYHKDGHEVCLLSKGYPTFDQSGFLKGYIGVTTDITLQKVKERKLIELNEKLNTLIESMPDAVFFKDSEGRWTIINEAAKRLFKLEGIEWYGKTDEALALIQPEKKEIYQFCKKSDENAWKEAKLTVNYECLPDDFGNLLEFQVTKVPLFESNGSRKGLVIIGKDVTKSKQEETRLKLLETVITNTSDGVIITEAFPYELPGPKIIYVNDAFLKMTGYTRAEVIDKSPRILQGIKTDNEELKKLKTALANNQACEIEVINYRKNGEEFYSNIAVSPVFNNQNELINWIAIKRDITESKKHEQNVKIALIKGQENEKEYIGKELHDNIAQLLIGSQMLLKSVKLTSEKDAERLKESNEGISKAIHEVRMLSHQLVPVTFYEDALITSMERLMKVTNIENKYKITIHYDQLDSINLDNQLQLNLYRILQEQLQNIIKHADAGIIEVSIRLQGNMLHMRIYDNGKGFDSNLIKGGGGIGLQNIRNRVETFFGSFSINSAIGHGCELVIKVPVEKLKK